MAISTSEILTILNDHDIKPDDDLSAQEFPDVGEIMEGESVYTTSISEVLGDDDEGQNSIINLDDHRIQDWWSGIERIIKNNPEDRPRPLSRERGANSPEPHCAWYCPIHFFGHGWGIYIREGCILSQSREIASFVRWRDVALPPALIARQLLRSAFYSFFLHEQFHHKVESLGFRLLIATNSDRYRNYKKNVYRRTYLSPDCLEESLANAESFRRLGEPRYVQRVDKAIRDGLKEYLRYSMPTQPPGYAEGVNYLSSERYKDGLYRLQSQMLDGAIRPTSASKHWSVAPNMITALTDITDDIYVVLPRGAKPVFRTTSIDPGATVSTSGLVSALTKHHGYEHVEGGKGSHVKLKKPRSQTIIIPGNKPVLSPGIVKHALNAIGGYPISRVRDLLEGKLRQIA